LFVFDSDSETLFAPVTVVLRLALHVTVVDEAWDSDIDSVRGTEMLYVGLGVGGGVIVCVTVIEIVLSTENVRVTVLDPDRVIDRTNDAESDTVCNSVPVCDSVCNTVCDSVYVLPDVAERVVEIRFETVVDKDGSCVSVKCDSEMELRVGSRFVV